MFSFSLPKLISKIWLRSMHQTHIRFHKLSHQLEWVQTNKLLGYLTENANTKYGQEYDFGGIKDYSTFASKIPLISDFDQIQPYIDRITRGEQQVLTNEDVLFFESTSASSGKAKWIPYTKSLKTEFQEGVGVWMHELYKKAPAVFSGHQYWSISPAAKDREVTSSGLAVGINNDLEYFGKTEAWMMGKVMAIPPSISQIRNADEFFFELCLALLEKEDLSFISVWSPNYLLKVHAFMQENKSEILAKLRMGTKRKTSTMQAINEGNWSQMFPKLHLVSCWTDAQASVWLEDLENILGGIEIQGKGLLATEGVATIPLASGQKALSYHSHFYEFIDEENGEIYLAHELQKDKTYELILTTGGGLYRYLTSDLVTVTGNIGGVPCFVFEGRKHQTSDLVGEKLTAKHVMEMIQILKEKTKVRVLGLVPLWHGNLATYQILTMNPKEYHAPIELAHAILSTNPYFEQAIKLGQLQALQWLDLGEGGDQRLFQFYCKKMGIKEGDAKLPLIFPINFLDDF